MSKDMKAENSRNLLEQLRETLPAGGLDIDIPGRSVSVRLNCAVFEAPVIRLRRNERGDYVADWVNAPGPGIELSSTEIRSVAKALLGTANIMEAVFDGEQTAVKSDEALSEAAIAERKEGRY